MKLKKLTIHNIASIEDAVIDFEAAPLSDSEVFLISGKTGSGKSTILDAICLALYATTPRMSNTNMDGKVGLEDNSISITDPRQLMRKNTGDCYVKLTFEGSNGVDYEAEWENHRAGERPDGKLQQKRWFLRNLAGGTTLSRDNEIRAEIQKAIGLDFKQFCRTTMLAQGEFTRFLDSNDSDKAEILEKITGLSVYAKIGKKVFEETKSRKEAVDGLNLKIGAVQPLSDSEKEDLRNQAKDFGKAYDALKKESDLLDEKRDWINLEKDFRSNLDSANSDLANAQTALADPSVEDRKRDIRQWDLTLDARQMLGDMKDAERRIARQDGCLNDMKVRFASVLTGVNYEKAELQAMAQKLADLRQAQEREKEREEVYKNAQTVVGFLNVMHDGRSVAEAKRVKIDGLKESLDNTLKPKRDELKQKWEQDDEAFMEHEGSVKELEAKAAEMKLVEVRRQFDAAKKLQHNIEKAEQDQDTLAGATTRHEAARANLNNRKKELEGWKADIAKLAPEVAAAKQAMETAKEVVERQRDTVDKFASAMRLKLKKGDTCPVCGQEVKGELPHEDALNELLDGLKRAYSEKEKTYNDYNDKKVDLESKVKVAEPIYERDYAAFVADTSIETAEQKLRAAYEQCGVTDADALAVAKTAVAERVTALVAAMKDAEEVENNAKKERANLEGEREKLADLKDELDKAESVVNKKMSEIKTEQELMSSKQQDADTACQEARKLLGGLEWKVDWNEEPKTFADRLENASKRYAQRRQDCEKLSADITQGEAMLKRVAGMVDEMTEKVAAWKLVEESDAQKLEHLEEVAQQLRSDVSDAATLKEHAATTMNQKRDELMVFLSEHEDMDQALLERLNLIPQSTIGQWRMRVNDQQNDVATKLQLRDKAQQTYDNHMATKPHMEESDTLEAIVARLVEVGNLMEDAAGKRGAAEERLRLDEEKQAQLGGLRQELDEAEKIYSRWSRLNELIGDANGATFRKIAQSYVLASLIHAANHYMKMLTDRYRLSVVPGTFVVLIEDAYQGFVTRAASTISGGESFLVSLSLALALSDIGHQLSVDTLFIDEGFGTLSGEPLQNAVNTLKSLHENAGRHVGIISHMEELREKIPVQIRVNQEGNSSKSVVEIVG